MIRAFLVLLTLGTLDVGCGGGSAPPPAIVGVPQPSASSAPVASVAPRPPEEPVLFTKQGVTVGEKIHGTTAIDLDLAFRSMDLTTRMRENIEEDRVVLAADANGPTKVRVHYTRYVDSSETSGQTLNTKDLSGKTFVVTATPKGPQVVDEKGKSPPHEDATVVAKAFHTLGRPDPLAAAMPTSIRPGDSVDGLAVAMTKVLGDDDAGHTSIKNVHCTFVGKRGDDGLFAISLVLERGDPSAKISVELSGEIAVSTKTSRASRMSLAGPVRIESVGSTPMEGGGQMSLTVEERSP